MLECPSCRQKVAHHGQNKWFECPYCRNWLCLFVGQSGVGYYELGLMLPNGVIRPVRLLQEREQPKRETDANRPVQALPDVRTMDLQKVREEKRRVRDQLRELTASRQDTAEQMRRIPMNDQQRRQSNALLESFVQEQRQLKTYEQQLAEREAGLLQVENELAQPTGASPSSSGCSTAVILNTIVAGLGIYAFTYFAKFPMDLRSFLILGVAALASAVISTVIAQI